jgi:hypothetical protein
LDLPMRSNFVQWDWDAAAGAFMRSQAGSPHMDVANGRISATNVIVLVATYLPSTIDRTSPEAQTVGSGQAYIFSDGHYRQAKWTRDNNLEPIALLDGKKDPIKLTPGNTWIERAESTGNTDPGQVSTEMTIR